MSIVDGLLTFPCRYLQEPQKGETEPNAFVALWTAKPKLVGCFFAAILIAIMVCYCIIRDFLYRKWGIRCFPRQRSPQHLRLESERRAIERQLEAQELHHSEVIMARRIERRQKYKQFLAPYTMIVTNTDFVHAVDKADGSREIHQIHDEATGDTIDVEAANHTAIRRDNKVEVNERMVKIANSVTGEPRYVDGNCSICLLDYKVGDAVIRSTRRDCSHAFHDECILSWLSQGKKRCPICRNFFVPASKIDCKKVITHDLNDLEASTPGTHLAEAEEDLEMEIDHLDHFDNDINHPDR